MHIIALFVSVVGAIAFFVIRAGMAAQAGRELGNLAGDALGAARRAKFRRSSTTLPLTQIYDEREAVAALLVAITKSEGDLTDVQSKVIQRLVEERLGYDDGAEILAHARWLTADFVDPEHVVHRVKELLLRNCNEEQRKDIISMLTEVAGIGSVPSSIQVQLIQKLAYDFGTHKTR